MASRGVYVEHLRKVDLFAGLTKKELEQVAMAGAEVDVAAGRVLLEQGHSGTDAFVVLKGTFVARRNGRKVATLHAIVLDTAFSVMPDKQGILFAPSDRDDTDVGMLKLERRTYAD